MWSLRGLKCVLDLIEDAITDAPLNSLLWSNTTCGLLEQFIDIRADYIELAARSATLRESFLGQMSEGLVDEDGIGNFTDAPAWIGPRMRGSMPVFLPHKRKFRERIE